MKKSFFLKYQDYKIGFRFTYDAGFMSYQHCVEPDIEDERFLWSAGIEAFQSRLLELYGDEKGNQLFVHIFCHLLNVAEREYVTNARRRKKRKSK